MYAARARIAKPATSAPSISLCGSWRMISRSLQLPGSDSSALMTRKLGLPGLGSLGMKPHFIPEIALDQLVRIVADDLAVLAAAGLGFVGVDDEEIGFAGLGLLGHEAPFHPRDRPRSACADRGG